MNQSNNTTSKPSLLAPIADDFDDFDIPELRHMKDDSALQHYLYLYQKNESVQRYIAMFNCASDEGKLRNHWLREVTTRRNSSDPNSRRALTLHELQYYIYKKTTNPTMNYYPAMTEHRIHFLFLAREFANTLCM